MKKVIASILTLVLCIGSLTACGKTNNETKDDGTTNAAPTAAAGSTDEASGVWGGDPVTLKMMVFPATENYEKINEKFLAANPDIDAKVDVEVVLGGSGDGDVAQKLRLALTSGQDLPDIIRLNYTQLPEFAEAGVLEPLGDYIVAYEDDIIDAAKAAMQYNGEYLAFPREIKPKVWFYRADIFEECGIDPYEVKTIDDYIAAGEKIREKYPNACMENYNVPSKNYDLMMMLSATDGRFCDEEGNYNLASDPNVKLTFERIKKIHDSAVNSSVAEWSADWAPAFSNGELVSQLIGGWFKTDFMNFGLEDQKDKWAIAPWPEEIREGSDAGGAIWVIPANSANKEVAAQYMSKLCFDKEAAKMIYDITGIIPASKSAQEDPYYNGEHDYYASSLGPVNFEAMEYLKVYPYTPASTQEVTIANQYLDEYLLGDMTLDEALESAQRDMISLIGNPYQQ
ncbi:MAG: extracellular solute-binding protein family 1 [Herbinix sp.]|jgi:ABC-type glycerol-3-phosphate transport system substrate-binding protein|nr:extracellular solute-binding protein family 1 [Herbinix sp.]